MEINCQFCHLQFKGDMTLKSHLQRVHHFCQRCDKKCENMQAFLKHCKEDHVFNHKCEKCNMKFLNLEELEKHDRSEHLPLDCPHCEYKGKNKEAIRRHLIIHSDISIKCEFCSYTTKRQKDMNHHLKKCGENANFFNCESCEHRYSNEKLLSLHVNSTHGKPKKIPTIKSTPTGPKKWHCEFCSYQTTNSKSRKEHLEVCSESIEKLQCELCEYRVPTISLLRMHKGRIHNQLKSQCEFCSYKSTHSDSMKNHARICGPDVEKFICDIEKSKIRLISELLVVLQFLV